MNYQRHYDLLIAKAKPRGLDKSQLTGYYELHHVLPRCLGGSDEAANLVLLTAREHFVAHWLLTKLTTGSDRHKMLYALAAFSMSELHRQLNSRAYALAQMAQAEAAKLTQTALLHVDGHNFQRFRSKQISATRALADSGQLFFQTEQGRLTANRTAADGHLYAQSEQGKKALSKVMQRTVTKQLTCPYCQASGTRARLNQTHFKYCSDNPDSKLRSILRAGRIKAVQLTLSQVETRCPHCCLLGKGVAMQRYHFDNCKLLSLGAPSCCLSDRPARSYTCEHCLAWFSTKGGLTKHYRRQHADIAIHKA